MDPIMVCVVVLAFLACIGSTISASKVARARGTRWQGRDPYVREGEYRRMLPFGLLNGHDGRAHREDDRKGLGSYVGTEVEPRSETAQAAF